MRDEPGIGAFVVAVPIDNMPGPAQRMLLDAEIERLRAAKNVVAQRAAYVFRLRTTMAPPELATGDAPPPPDA